MSARSSSGRKQRRRWRRKCRSLQFDLQRVLHDQSCLIPILFDDFLIGAMLKSPVRRTAQGKRRRSARTHAVCSIPFLHATLIFSVSRPTHLTSVGVHSSCPSVPSLGLFHDPSSIRLDSPQHISRRLPTFAPVITLLHRQNLLLLGQILLPLGQTRSSPPQSRKSGILERAPKRRLNGRRSTTSDTRGT
jgi:hypothetical protein